MGKLSTPIAAMTVHDSPFRMKPCDGVRRILRLAYEFHMPIAQAGWTSGGDRQAVSPNAHHIVCRHGASGYRADERNWHDYDETYGMILDGTLFTKEQDT